MMYHRTYRELNPLDAAPQSRSAGCIVSLLVMLLVIALCIVVGWIEPIVDCIFR